MGVGCVVRLLEALLEGKLGEWWGISVFRIGEAGSVWSPGDPSAPRQGSLVGADSALRSTPLTHIAFEWAVRGLVLHESPVALRCISMISSASSIMGSRMSLSSNTRSHG